MIIKFMVFNLRETFLGDDERRYKNAEILYQEVARFAGVCGRDLINISGNADTEVVVWYWEK